jgi:hypothetical protein
MSETKKRKSDSQIWAYNAHGGDDPLIKVLERLANRDAPKYVRPDSSINRMRLTHDILVVGARKLCMDTGDTEGLRLLDEHEHLMATRAALREGKPLPDAIMPTQPQAAAPVSTPTSTETQTSVTSQTETTPPSPVTPITPAPKPPKQEKRIVNLVINESGRSRIKRE